MTTMTTAMLAAKGVHKTSRYSQALLQSEHIIYKSARKMPLSWIMHMYGLLMISLVGRG